MMNSSSGGQLQQVLMALIEDHQGVVGEEAGLSSISGRKMC